jgi:hypothetical protein
MRKSATTVLTVLDAKHWGADCRDRQVKAFGVDESHPVSFALSTLQSKERC